MAFEQMTELRSILAIPCTCTVCYFRCLSGDAESGADGKLVCPLCYGTLKLHLNEHERNPTGNSNP